MNKDLPNGAPESTIPVAKARLLKNHWDGREAYYEGSDPSSKNSDHVMATNR